ncbi:MAG TPA: TonB-dependent receptor plug domain-containing protein, partial [Bacteroidota bacterium]|nr:TonB-dependent receptor plug domain-containing protein [Bacteroidota bacterium]
MDEILVERDRAFPGVSIPGVILIDPGRLSDLPALGGETDLLRGLQLLPGVKSISELSSGLYIRGTTSDQNLYTLDGATIYNPTHLWGFISTINPDALRDTRLSKGMFSPENGGRIGGVVDMMEREGTQERIRGSAGLSFLDARLSLEGPISEGTTFMVAARRAYFDLILPLVVSRDDPAQRYYFYDVTAKVNTRLSESDHLFASGYLGRDVYTSTSPSTSSETTDIWWGNSTANLRWTHIHSPSLFTVLSAVYSTYNFSSEQNDRYLQIAPLGLSSHSGIQDITVKTLIEYYVGSRTTIRAGVDLVRHQIRSDVGENVAQNPGAIFDRPVITPLCVSLWVSDRWNADDVLAFDIGARLSRFSSSVGSFTRFEPRVSAEMTVAENLLIHGVVSESSQFL